MLCWTVSDKSLGQFFAGPLKACIIFSAKGTEICAGREMRELPDMMSSLEGVMEKRTK